MVEVINCMQWLIIYFLFHGAIIFSNDYSNLNLPVLPDEEYLLNDLFYWQGKAFKRNDLPFQQQEDFFIVEKNFHRELPQGANLFFAKPFPPQINIDLSKFIRLGNQKSPILFLEFGDYLCPHCKEIVELNKKIIHELGGKLNWIYVDYSIISRKRNQQLAEGAYCADEQGFFIIYHEYLFEHQEEILFQDVKAIAQQIKNKAEKFSTQQFEECIQKHRYQKQIDLGYELAKKMGVKSTPTVFINGVRQEIKSQKIFFEELTEFLRDLQ